MMYHDTIASTKTLYPQQMIPLSLYIHIPWCIRKCPYCDFNSHKSPEILPEHQYVNALLDDLKADVARFSNQTLRSIFIGGGTPSLFSATAYANLFTEIQQVLPFANDIEITLEANPGTIEQGRFNDYRALGINRLSLGIQSFNPTHLRRLGRIHDEKQAHKAIDCARQAGFDNINIDIMHGLPGQSIAESLDDLHTGLAHEPEHLSWYQLTIEPNTVFYKTRPTLPTEDDAYAMEEEGLAILNAHHYNRYEISAFSKQNKQAQHNLNYWLFGDYYGIGAGAHGKLTTPDLKQVYRTRKHRQPIDYLNSSKPYLAGIDEVNKHELLFEFMLNTTRLEQPIKKSLITERTGLPYSALEPLLQQAVDKGLVYFSETHWQITPFGRRYTNNLQEIFLPD